MAWEEGSTTDIVSLLNRELDEHRALAAANSVNWKAVLGWRLLDRRNRRSAIQTRVGGVAGVVAMKSARPSIGREKHSRLHWAW
jgi:hypothetical protein